MSEVNSLFFSLEIDSIYWYIIIHIGDCICANFFLSQIQMIIVKGVSNGKRGVPLWFAQCPMNIKTDCRNKKRGVEIQRGEKSIFLIVTDQPPRINPIISFHSRNTYARHKFLYKYIIYRILQKLLIFLFYILKFNRWT